jgi:hypothetical protein
MNGMKSIADQRGSDRRGVPRPAKLALFCREDRKLVMTLVI